MTTFCCDSDSIINLRDAGLLQKFRSLIRSDKAKIPEGVYRELKKGTDQLSKSLTKWAEKYPLVIDLDYAALQCFPDIERKYGPRFAVGGKVYSGLWASTSGRKSADAQVIALAKARGWIAVSDDDSVHGACMLEGITCWGWEEIGRLLLHPEQPLLPGFEVTTK